MDNNEINLEKMRAALASGKLYMELASEEKINALAQFHVCGAKPVPGHDNYVGTCEGCGDVVYFLNLVEAKKICVACYFKLKNTDPRILISAKAVEKQAMEKMRN